MAALTWVNKLALTVCLFGLKAFVFGIVAEDRKVLFFRGTDLISYCVHAHGLINPSSINTTTLVHVPTRYSALIANRYVGYTHTTRLYICRQAVYDVVPKLLLLVSDKSIDLFLRFQFPI